MILSKSLQENITTAKSILPISNSFDIITRTITLGNISGYFIGINGLCKLDLLQDIFSNLQNPLYYYNLNPCSMKELVEQKIGYAQVTLTSNWDILIKNVLSGPGILFLDGFEQALILDTRSYPTRGISEPETEKIIREAKDGFVETVLFNTNMIRRRIRSPKLTFEITSIGKESKTDIVIAFMNGLAEEDLLLQIRKKLSGIDADSLTMGMKSLEELLLHKRWYHPLPAFFSTERPDVACSYLMEGYVLLMVDTTPAALILPCSLFQFTQSPEDYYKSTVVGTYIRIIRFICLFLSLFLFSVFLLLASNPGLLPESINLMPSGSIEPFRLFFYVLIAELILDLFKYSSSHAPGGFSGSLAIVGGLLIGNVAIELQWASTEVIFYAAATLLTSLSLPNIDLSESIRVYRLFLTILTGLFDLPGFLIGLVLIGLSIFTTPVFAGKSYFWPLIPFNFSALKTLLIRYPTFMAQPNHIWHHTSKKKN